MNRVLAVVIALTLALFAAGSTAAQQHDALVGERFPSFEMAWKSANPETVAARARAAAEVMTGQRLKRRASVVPLKSFDGVSRRMQVNVRDAPGLNIVYMQEYDELRIVDTELAASTEPKSEISQEEALKVAKNVLVELARGKLVDPRHFNWDKVDIASTWIGRGSRDSKAVEKRRVEYRITLRRELNGIELANAGVRIAVHASGRLSGLRLGGVSVASKAGPSGLEEPTGKGRWLRRGAATGDLAARFEREVVPEKAKPKVAWSRVMYVMPETKRTAVVEPLYVVSYSLEFPSDEGNTAISRRKTVGFSLVDPKAAPIDLTPPVRAPEIEKTRKERAVPRQRKVEKTPVPSPAPR